MDASDGPTTVVVIIDEHEIAVTLRPDLTLIDALAQLQLAARRRGSTVRLREPSDRLRELLDLVALPLPLEVVGQTERGEELGVDEVVEPDDPPA